MTKIMAIALISVVTAVAVVGCADGSPVVSVSASESAKVARGSYLVKIMGCNDCHTPGLPAAGRGQADGDALTRGQFDRNHDVNRM
jgi:mono/diheme cytochrome c family protein